MEGKFLHLLTLLKKKFPLDHHLDPQKVPHRTEGPTVSIRSRDAENPSGSKPMPTFDPSDLLVGLAYFHLKRMGEAQSQGYQTSC